ncbi:uncharacterized protein LOC119994971 [Tripterygium wilfordii]|uniref:uncharacterized protein LOC119994971 n=1 Tax=Tripterygium wilfordii TaxID=458696 RepID=UPI0018F81B65|nr:uncharacterized protein LOC119994971 [Tripterygium wilfordii]
MTNFFKNFTIKTKYRAVVATATPIVIFSGICVAWAYIHHGRKRRSKAGGVLSRSMSFGVLHGGKLALKRLVDYHKARADPATLEAAEMELRNLISEEQPDFKRLQGTVAKLEMSGKENIAISVLEEALRKSIDDNQPHEAYETEMLLVEMHIYKGDFRKALNYKCLKEEAISDDRQPLYKAILYVMVEDSKEAYKNWEEFQELRTHHQWPLGMHEDQSYKVVTDFGEFEKVVRSLREDIIQVHKSGTKKF